MKNNINDVFNKLFNRKHLKKYSIILTVFVLIIFALFHTKIQSVSDYNEQQQSLSQSKNFNIIEDETVQNAKGIVSEITSSGNQSELISNSNSNTVTVSNSDSSSNDNSNNKSSNTINNDNYSDTSFSKSENLKEDSVNVASPNTAVSVPSNTAIVETSNRNSITCKIEIRCDALSSNLGKWTNQTKNPDDIVPSNGIILGTTTVSIKEGTSAYDVLLYVTQVNHIAMETTNSIFYNTIYIQSISQIKEKDAGPMSGWIYKVNNVTISYGMSQYKVNDGDFIQLLYSCNGGTDLQ